MNSLKLFFYLVFILVVLAGSQLQGQDPAAELVIPDSLFDFGYFAVDGKVMHRFWLYNEGDDTLRIIKVKAHCGCSTAPIQSDNIAPGDSTYVDFYFDSKRLTGLVKKSASIISNDPERPLRDITIVAFTGQPHPLVEITPEVVNMGRLSMDKLDNVFVAEIKNKMADEIHLDLVDFSEAYVRAELADTILKAGETTKLKMTLLRIPNKPHYYHFSASMDAYLEDGKKKRFTVPAVGRLNRIE